MAMLCSRVFQWRERVCPAFVSCVLTHSVGVLNMTRAAAEQGEIMSIEAMKLAHDLSLDGKHFEARQLLLEAIEEAEKQEGWVLREVLFADGEAIAHREPEKQKPGQVEFDYRHPRAQALIADAARNRIYIDLIWRILEDPHQDFTASDTEYWDAIHDAVYAAVIKREWQGLTDEQIGQIIAQCKITLVNYCSDEKQKEFARAIETKLKEKNT